MITLMIMAQDYTAFEPVTSGVWIDKTIDPKCFNEVDVSEIKHKSTIMCGDKVMGTYSHERAVDIMKDIAIRTGSLNSNMEYNIAFNGNEYQSIDYHNATEWTYYMPQE